MIIYNSKNYLKLLTSQLVGFILFFFFFLCVKFRNVPSQCFFVNSTRLYLCHENTFLLSKPSADDNNHCDIIIHWLKISKLFIKGYDWLITESSVQYCTLKTLHFSYIFIFEYCIIKCLSCWNKNSSAISKHFILAIQCSNIKIFEKICFLSLLRIY